MNRPHLLPDPDATAYTPPPPPEPDTILGESAEDAAARTARTVAEAAADTATWLRLSAAISEHVPAIADREDVTVSIGPGAGHGAPGCFLPAQATIELDSATLTDLGIDPATCTPRRISDRERYAPTWGVFVHECAHARHTNWEPPATAQTTTSTAALGASMMLEESRIEAAHLARRPGDRRWLRASATALILPDILTLQAATSPGEAPAPPEAPTTSGTPAPEPPATEAPSPPAPAPDEPSPAPATPEPSAPPEEASELSLWSAAHAAGLLLARVDAGVLDEDEVSAVTEAITPTLGADRLAALRAIWCAAHEVADTDADTMIQLGRDWCTALDVDPDRPDPTDGLDPATSTGLPSPLTAAVITTLGAISAADTPDEAPTLPGGRGGAREEENNARHASEAAASAVFGPAGTRGARSGGRTQIRGTRPPTPQESAAARRLARALREAGSRERIAVTTTSATPPGRLSMRGAMAADAQRAAGATPTAEPFTRTTRRHVPTPPLRVAIACDVSASMAAAAPVIASTAWILARATGFVTDAKSATVIYGQHVRPITRPGQTPTEITEFDADDGTEKFTRAIDALDAALDLTRADAARLLVIVSDGYYTAEELTTGQQRINRLRAAGCAVLWITLNHWSTPMTGTTHLVLEDPATAAQAIARAATTALRHA